MSMNETFDLFDWKRYLTIYNDLKDISNKEDAWKHWQTLGKEQNRIPCFDTSSDYPTINILTRTGTRTTYYKTLKDSIHNQTYKNIRHIKSNDNPECTFLSNEVDVVSVEKKKEKGSGFYNLYLNDLGKQVDNGWIIVLDDDSKLIDNTFIESLAKICAKSREKDVLIYQTRLAKRRIVPKDELFKQKSIVKYRIDMSCFCVHHTVFKKFPFNAERMGDFRFLNSIKRTKQYCFRFVTLPIGIWANYDGEKYGEN